MLALLWLTIFGQWAIHTYCLIFMVVATKFVQEKQNKPKSTATLLSFTKKLT